MAESFLQLVAQILLLADARLPAQCMRQSPYLKAASCHKSMNTKRSVKSSEAQEQPKPPQRLVKSVLVTRQIHKNKWQFQKQASIQRQDNTLDYICIFVISETNIEEIMLSESNRACKSGQAGDSCPRQAALQAC